MANTAKQGTFVIDAQNNTVWSSSGQSVDTKDSSQIDSGSGGLHQVEVWTGELSRDDSIPSKPIAAMSYGGRVRIARLYKGYEEFIGKVIRVGGWAKSTRASSADFCFVELNDGSCFKNL